MSFGLSEIVYIVARVGMILLIPIGLALLPFPPISDTIVTQTLLVFSWIWSWNKYFPVAELFSGVLIIMTIELMLQAIYWFNWIINFISGNKTEHN